jgi:hypothetical protein
LTASAFGPFANAIGHTTRLAHANPHTAAIVTDDDNGAEGETASTFNYFGDALDIDYALVQFVTIIVTAS